MGLTVGSDEKGVKIFRKDGTSSAGNPYTLYSLSISSKQQDGTWLTDYFDCGFKNGVSLNNKAVIKIKKAWWVISQFNNQKRKKIFIADFDVLDAGESNDPVQVSADEFMAIPDGLDDELPWK